MVLKSYDVAVIGAGPAGSTLAIRLSRMGLKVILSDKDIPGRGKVCGGFLGPEIVPILDVLEAGYILPSIDAKDIKEVMVSGPMSKLFVAKLPHGGGFAADRGDFDGALYAEAQSAGAHGIAPAMLTNKEYEHGLWSLKFTRGSEIFEVSARALVYATGRRPAVRAIVDKRKTFYACKTVYENVSGLDDKVALHFVTKGHVGLNPLGHGRATICLYAEESHLRNAKGNLDRMMENFMKENTHLKMSLSSATRIADWKSCQAQPDNARCFIQENAFNVGDAVTMVHPIVGGGIPIAMHSSLLLAEALERGLNKGHSVQEIAVEYGMLWNKKFMKRIQFAAALGYAERSQIVSVLTFSMLRIYEPLFSRLVRKSRATKKELATSLS